MSEELKDNAAEKAPGEEAREASGKPASAPAKPDFDISSFKLPETPKKRSLPGGRFSRKEKLELIALIFLLLFGWFFVSTIRGMSKKLDEEAMKSALYAGAICEKETVCGLWTI